MDNFNYHFFEEFTKLDKLCVSVYQVEGGTLGYLAQMRSVSGSYADYVPHWTTDLEQLHRYRSIYQALAQSPDAFEECLCGLEDVRWVREFQARIMERKDPLALLQIKGYRAEEDAIQRLEDERSGEVVIQSTNPRDRYVNGPVVVVMILVAVVLTCLACALILPVLGSN